MTDHPHDSIEKEIQEAQRLDGAAVAAEIRDGLRFRIEAFSQRAGRPPTLGILLAGNDPGSEIYVRNKMRSGEDLGMATDLRPVRARWRHRPMAGMSAVILTRKARANPAATAVTRLVVQSPGRK